MLIEIKPGEGLMPGVYRVVIILDKSEQGLYDKWPFQFDIVDLPARRLVPEREYLCPPLEHDGCWKGRFLKGIFWGYCYTNGCSEEKNPTPIEKVKAQLAQTLEEKFKMLSDQNAEQSAI